MRTQATAVSLRTGGSRVWHAIDLHGITLLVRRQVRPRQPGDDSRAPRRENLCEIADMAKALIVEIAAAGRRAIAVAADVAQPAPLRRWLPALKQSWVR